MSWDSFFYAAIDRAQEGDQREEEVSEENTPHN